MGPCKVYWLTNQHIWQCEERGSYLFFIVQPVHVKILHESTPIWRYGNMWTLLSLHMLLLQDPCSFLSFLLCSFVLKIGVLHGNLIQFVSLKCSAFSVDFTWFHFWHVLLPFMRLSCCCISFCSLPYPLVVEHIKKTQ